MLSGEARDFYGRNHRIVVDHAKKLWGAAVEYARPLLLSCLVAATMAALVGVLAGPAVRCAGRALGAVRRVVRYL